MYMTFARLLAGAVVLISLFSLPGCTGDQSGSTTAETELESSSEATQLVARAEPVKSILEVMLLEITPATNVLWGVGNPQTDEEWRVLEDAALATIEAVYKTAEGGAGPMDNEWASHKNYQAFNNEMLSAAEAAVEAIKQKDISALLEAGNAIYEPCEGCHLEFNPGVVNQQY